jgi:RHS repeat-associated protein
LSDENGVITDSYDYDAFGQLLNETGNAENSYRFAGEQLDGNLDQYYLRARYYNQNAGRFTQLDTYMGNASQPITLNKYTYANSDPVQYIDPTGRYGNLAETSAASSINSTLALSIQTVRVGGLAANDAVYTTGVISSKQAGLLIIAAGASGSALIQSLVKDNTSEDDPEESETLYHGTSSNLASKIIQRGFRSAPVFFGEDFVTAETFGRIRAGLNGTANVTIIEFTIPKSIAQATITYRDTIGEFLGLGFVDIPGGSGFERVLEYTPQLQIFNGALLSGIIKQRRLK